MGMMTRRNVKQRAVAKTAPFVSKETTNDFSIDGKYVGNLVADNIEITDRDLVLENQYTKTEINRMSTADLKEVAKLNGIDNVEDMTGSDLKKVLIEKFGL